VAKIMNDCSVSSLANVLDKNPGPVKDDETPTGSHFMDVFWNCAAEKYADQMDSPSAKSLSQVAFDLAKEIDKVETKEEGVDLTELELTDISLTIGLKDNREKK
jgi:hypothetical protein